MGWLGVGLGLLSCWLLYGNLLAFALAIAVTLGLLWTWGVMHNYATESARRRPGYKGGFYDLSDADIDAVPGWLPTSNLVLTLVTVVLCVYGGYSHLRS